MNSGTEELKSELFSGTANVYAVLDGASVPKLLENLDQFRPEFACLYRGELKPDLAQVAPYLIRLEAESEFSDWVIRKGWGNHWGIFLISDADFSEIRTHLRRLLTVYTEEGKPLLFRFYDPRVIRQYLPTCTTSERMEFFGPIRSYIVEDKDRVELLKFTAELRASEKHILTENFAQ